MSKRKVIYLTISFFIFFGSIGLYLEYEKYSKKQKLLDHGRFSIATITDVLNNGTQNQQVSPSQKTYSPFYEFKINGVKFEGGGNSVIQDTKLDRRATGSRYYVVYFPENPSINSLLPDCELSDSLTCPQNGWDHIPCVLLK